MFFAAPLALLGLLALPAILLLLRLNPPPAKRIKFPPLALLINLATVQRTPHRMPLWLLLLRLAAAAFLIFGLAGPGLHPPPALPGNGPILLVIDNGWATAADWPARLDTARRILTGAAQSGRAVSILATAPDASGAAPHIQGLMAAPQAAQIVDALQPQPWPADRKAAATALQSAPRSTRLYIADGITDGAGFADFLKILKPDRIYSNRLMPSLLLPPTISAGGTLTAHLLDPAGPPRLLAKTASGDVLFSAGFNTAGDASITLPAALSNQLASLSLANPITAATMQLLDGSARSTLIGLTAGGPDAETPFLGPLYFIRRAMPAGAQIASGRIANLLTDKANVIIVADSPLSAAEQITARDWIAQGGVELGHRTNNRNFSCRIAAQRHPNRPKCQYFETSSGRPHEARSRHGLGHSERRHTIGYRQTNRPGVSGFRADHRECRLVEPRTLRVIPGHADKTHRYQPWHRAKTKPHFAPADTNLCVRCADARLQQCQHHRRRIARHDHLTSTSRWHLRPRCEHRRAQSGWPYSAARCGESAGSDTAHRRCPTRKFRRRFDQHCIDAFDHRSDNFFSAPRPYQNATMRIAGISTDPDHRSTRANRSIADHARLYPEWRSHY
jgi:hypothetical protein